MADSVLVIGAGIAGLSTALALADGARRVTLVEKDPPPPEGGPDVAFADWKRTGVGHVRHSHAFLARLRTLMVAHHPKLLAELLEAGCRELKFADAMRGPMRDAYKPLASDEELAVLTSRRTTLEMVIRRYVENLPNVGIESGVFVREAILENDAAGHRRVAGLRVSRGEGPVEEMRADITVDAGGRLSQIPEQLTAAGAVIAEEAEDCGILYYTRHYRLRPGMSEPEPSKAGGTGDLGYIKFGLFPGDNGCFSITLAVPEIETDLRTAVMRPEVFQTICEAMAGLADWVDPTRSDAADRVYGMGDLRGHWRRYGTAEAPAALDFFPVGDSLIRTNPLYGRGCSFAMVSAFELKGVLAASADKTARAADYESRIRSVLRPHFESMRTQDRAAIKRAAASRDPNPPPPKTDLRSRLGRSFGEDGVAIALRSDPVLMRAAMRDFHMLDKPGAWLRNPTNMARILYWWSRGKKRNADRYPVKVGPGRTEMFGKIGLAA